MQSDVLYKRNDHMTVYLDNAATTKPCEAAVQAVINNITLDYGNPIIAAISPKGTGRFYSLQRSMRNATGVHGKL